MTFTEKQAREPVGDGPSARICALKDAEVAVRQRLIDLAHTYRGQEGKLSSAIFKAESIANMAICLLLSDARNGSPVPPAAPVLPMEPSEDAKDEAYEKAPPEVTRTDVTDMLRAAYVIDAKAPDAEQEEWRTMESAPMDGAQSWDTAQVQMWAPTLYRGSVTIGNFDPDKSAKKPRPFWKYVGHDISVCRANPPTHWRRLPTPPHAGDAK